MGAKGLALLASTAYYELESDCPMIYAVMDTVKHCGRHLAAHTRPYFTGNHRIFHRRLGMKFNKLCIAFDIPYALCSLPSV
jgi:hypothetical protein